MAKKFYHNLTTGEYNIRDIDVLVEGMDTIDDLIVCTEEGNALIQKLSPTMISMIKSERNMYLSNPE